MKNYWRLVICGFLLMEFFDHSPGDSAEPIKPFRIVVLDRENDWPVPMVELRTLHRVVFVTDNAGVVAMDLPELMGQETWLDVLSPGYEVAKDGFGMRGVRVTPQPGGTATIRVTRTAIAKRLGRLTGAGLLAESQKLGDAIDGNGKDLRDASTESNKPATVPVLGCDSVQTAVHQGKLFWLWGDTNLANYPLGIFHMTGATTRLNTPIFGPPPLRWKYEYFFDDKRGRPKAMAPMAGKGPTWLTGVVSLPDKNGTEHLVALYRKIQPPMEIYELGTCEWNDADQAFHHTATLWTLTEEPGAKPPTKLDEGHASLWTDTDQVTWVLLGNPFPHVKFRATFEAWQDIDGWEVLPKPMRLLNTTDEEVKPHSGSIAWFPYRQRWATIFMQSFGKPSAFGEIWYAESKSPFGPWSTVIKVLSHDNYTFYNPRIHPEFSQGSPSRLFFEGTYTHQFAKAPPITPRYDYNQILYELDLDEPALAAARIEP